MWSHGRWESSLGRVTEEGFLKASIIWAEPKDKKEPATWGSGGRLFSTELCDVQVAAGNCVLLGLIDCGTVFRLYSIINGKCPEDLHF